MVTHPAHAFHAHVPALVPPVVSCVGDPFYKITSEALLVTQQLVKVGVKLTTSSFLLLISQLIFILHPVLRLHQVIRPLDSQSEASDSFDPSPYINDLFTCTIKRLKAADIDQEVKERAISCMGQIICNLGNAHTCQSHDVMSHSFPLFNVFLFSGTGDHLPAELPGTLLIFLERLKNEITRLTTVKGKPRPHTSCVSKEACLFSASISK